MLLFANIFLKGKNYLNSLLAIWEIFIYTLVCIKWNLKSKKNNKNTKENVSNKNISSDSINKHTELMRYKKRIKFEKKTIFVFNVLISEERYDFIKFSYNFLWLWWICISV